MARLEELCIYTESLCAAGEAGELRSLLPYLIYIWQRAGEGLQKLMPMAEGGPRTPACSPGQLQRYLQAFQRRPALECIDALILVEPEETSRQQLVQMRAMVDAFRFDDAVRAYEEYQKERDPK